MSLFGCIFSTVLIFVKHITLQPVTCHLQLSPVIRNIYFYSSNSRLGLHFCFNCDSVMNWNKYSSNESIRFLCDPHLTHLVTEEQGLKSYNSHLQRILRTSLSSFILSWSMRILSKVWVAFFSFSINRFKAKLRLNSGNFHLGLGRLCEGRHLHGCYGENETRSNPNVGNIFESVVKSWNSIQSAHVSTPTNRKEIEFN